MKKLLLITLTLVLITGFASNAFAKKQVFTHSLAHNVIAEVVLPTGYTNTAMITFKTQDDGVLGSLTLSPAQSKIENLTYRLGKQKIHIQTIQLGVPSYDKEMASVVINCKISNWFGKHTERYNGMIASWAGK